MNYTQEMLDDFGESIMSNFLSIPNGESLTSGVTISSNSTSGDWTITIGNDWGVFGFGHISEESSLIPERVIFNPPATICIFPDGEKIVVKCTEGEPFVEEYGVMACIIKKVFGSRNAFKRLVESGYRQQEVE